MGTSWLGRGGRWAVAGAGLLVFSLPMIARAQGTAACPAAKDPVPAAMAYAKGDFADAETLYGQALLRSPKDPELTAGLVRSRLRQGKVAEAAATVETALGETPGSAALLTARGELELREGLPWRARRTLTQAAGADPCYARVALVRSRIDRLDSMYATERREVQAAYDLDAKDPEIKRTYNQTVMPANDITGAEEYLATQKTVDPELRKAAETSVKTMMPLLSETSQMCQGLPAVGSATLPLLPSMQDGRHVDGYRLEVQIGPGKAMLGVDTAASGLYISRALADANGLAARVGDPPGTVHADMVRVGPLEFRDCVVGVSEAAFPGKAAGYVGTDLFSGSLVTLNFPQAKLQLEPLPAVTGYVPGDRLRGDGPGAAALRGYSPVYHRLQYLLVPVTLNNREQRLFALDSGIRLSTMTLPVAHAVSTTQRNFTNPMKTTAGTTFQVYRDAFDFEFADLKLPGRTGVLEFDSETIEQHAQMAIGGMLGFDMLHAAVLHLDYRDGLIKLEFPDGEAVPAGGTELIARAGSGAADAGATGGAAKAVCAQDYAPEVPAAATIVTQNTGLWDAAHMKAGEKVSVKVLHAWLTPACRLLEGSLVYGHVTAAASAKNGGRPQLGVSFDQAECDGKGKRELPLKLISVVGAPAEFVGLHTRMAVAIGGGRGRSIGDAVEAEGGNDDLQLNPETMPSIVEMGTVRGLPTVKLDPDGGPSCSALLTSSSNTLHLGPQTKFLVVMAEDSKK